jgi:hypothetical protein
MTDRTAPVLVDRFEDRLLRQLLTELPPPTDHRPGLAPAHRRRRLVFAAGALGTAVAGALAAILVVVTTGPAYAIRPRPDGSFDVVLSGTDPTDLADVETDLQQRGAPVELVAQSLSCLGVLDRPRLASPPHASRSGPPSEEDYPEFHAFRPVLADDGARRNPITGGALESREWAFTVQPRLIPAGQVLWVAVAGTDSATLVLVVEFAPAAAGQPDFCADR